VHELCTGKFLGGVRFLKSFEVVWCFSCILWMELGASLQVYEAYIG
jgi:hypothetical protein